MGNYQQMYHPTTTVGSSKLNDKIKIIKVFAIENNIVKYNTWSEDSRERIIKEEYGGYNKYRHSIFYA